MKAKSGKYDLIINRNDQMESEVDNKTVKSR